MAMRRFIPVALRQDLGTRRILAEVQRLLGEDDLGRPYPAYSVIHKALVELRDRLKKKGKGHPRVDRGNASE